MPFLPIAERELRVAARRRSIYRTRFWAVMAALLAFCWWWFETSRSGGGSAASHGQQLFLTFVVLAFCFALFSGTYTTADCLSAEKRDGTLGLLFLTDLKGYDIVLGKLVANSLGAAYGLVAIVPMLAVPILMGGVSVPDFLQAIVAIVTVLFLSLAAGIVASVHNRNERTATFFTIFIVLVVLVVPLLAGFIAQAYFNVNDAEKIGSVLCFSPIMMLVRIFEKTAKLPGYSFWKSAAVGWSWTSLFLLWVSLRLPASWQDKGSEAKVRKENRVAHIARRQQRRKRLRAIMDINPFYWLSFRKEGKATHAWGFLSAIIAIWFFGFFWWAGVMFDGSVTVPIAVLLNTFFKVWVVTESCQQLIEARRSGALELLLSTPLTERDIVRGQWLALRRQFVVPFAIICILEFLLAIVASEDFWFRIAWVLSLPVDFIALGWVGMWLGLTARSTTRAIIKAVFLILGVPWIVYQCGGFALKILMPVPRRLLLQVLHEHLGNFAFRLPAVFWLLITLMVAYGIGFRWARNNVLRKFRLTATEQYGLRKADD